jgi:hypothetical protein
MILTPIEPAQLTAILDLFAASLAEPARGVFLRIADPRAARRAEGAAALAHHAAACALAESLDMGLLPGSPALDFSWNGHSLRGATEAYVLLHEVAHFQLATPQRRKLVDFGLGPGPESGNRATAAAMATVSGLASEVEEARASLLGILWEVEFGQPGLASWLDQNWLEGAGRPAAAAHFNNVLAQLRDLGLVDDHGKPQRRLAEF